MVRLISILMVGFLVAGCGQEKETSSSSQEKDTSSSPNEVPQVQTPITPPPPPEPESTVKTLTCTEKNSTVQWVLDTKDFSKENPESEYSLVRLEGSNERSGFSDLIEGDVTQGQLEGLGKVHRVTYDTTPQYLIFKVPLYPGCPWELNKILGDSTVSVFNPCEETRTISVSRETLLGEMVETKLTYQCQLETFDIKSNQI